jgi:hypothetical protein
VGARTLRGEARLVTYFAWTLIAVAPDLSAVVQQRPPDWALCRNGYVHAAARTAKVPLLIIQGPQRDESRSGGHMF